MGLQKNNDLIIGSGNGGFHTLCFLFLDTNKRSKILFFRVFKYFLKNFADKY